MNNSDCICSFSALNGHPIKIDIQVIEEFFTRIRLIFHSSGLYIIPVDCSDNTSGIEELAFHIFIPANAFLKYKVDKNITRVINFQTSIFNKSISTVKKKESMEISISEKDGTISEMYCYIFSMAKQSLIAGKEIHVIQIQEEIFDENMICTLDPSKYELPVKFESCRFQSFKKSLKVNKNNIRISIQSNNFLQISSDVTNTSINSPIAIYTIGDLIIPPQYITTEVKMGVFDNVLKKCKDVFSEEFQNSLIFKLNKISALGKMISFYKPIDDDGVLKISIQNGDLGELQVYIKHNKQLQAEHDATED